jgi:hypothetical protein
MIQSLILVIAISSLLFVFGFWILFCFRELSLKHWNLFWFDLVIGIIAQVALWYRVVT